jgi:hypothetical protein
MLGECTLNDHAGLNVGCGERASEGIQPSQSLVGLKVI